VCALLKKSVPATPSNPRIHRLIPPFNAFAKCNNAMPDTGMPLSVFEEKLNDRMTGLTLPLAL